LEKEKTKSVRTACVKVWTKLFCGISRRYQEFANVAIFPVLKLLAEDPQEDMKLVGVHMLCKWEKIFHFIY
jgi:hypothetical protein